MTSGAPEPTEDPAPTGIEAAFFDLDKTIIAKGAMIAFRGPLYNGGLINRRSLTRAIFAQLVYFHLGASEIRLMRLRETVMRITKGWDSKEVARIVDEALSEIVEPIIFAEAMDLIEQHRAEGRLIVIVSASPIEIVKPLGHHLGVDETISSRAGTDDEDRYTGHMDFYAYGPYKAEAIRALATERGIDLSASYAYSDSYTDLPMLETVGHPVAVNPDRVLSRIARDRSWEVLKFVRPVRLRDRVRDRVNVSPEPRTLALGFVICAGASGVIWWVTRRHIERAVRERLRTGNP